ncbi:MAG: 50S ribosomal protein L24e [Candidatus Nanoarchaeia archaeon]
MPICSFCKKEFDRTSGKMFIQNSGKILYFCSSKCEKNMLKLKRNPLKLKWVRKINI